jgi:peptidyl-prolyl cis-trans isomerase SurA
MSRFQPTSLSLFLLLLLSAPLAAQRPDAPGELVERIAAVVGDSVILQSDIDEEILRQASAGLQVPDDPFGLDALRREVLEHKITELLLVQAALRDSIVIPVAEVEHTVQQELTQRQRTFGSAQAFEAALRQEGLTLPDYQNMLGQQVRRQLLIRSYVMKQGRERRPPFVTEQEMRAHFEGQRAAIGPRPVTLSFRQVVVPARAGEAARAAARASAQDVLDRIRGGEDFAQLARRFSEDPSTRERGGDLGWFRRGTMVRSFEDAAYALRPGETSGIVESPFGFHIIRLEKVRGPERQARHILIRPAIGEEDAERQRADAEIVADALRGGSTSVTELVARYGDPLEEDRVGPVVRERLPEPWLQQLRAATAGSVVGPFPLPTAGGEPAKLAVIRVTEVNESGEYAFEDPMVRAQVRQELEQQKLIEELLSEIRRRTHVELRI